MNYQDLALTLEQVTVVANHRAMRAEFTIEPSTPVWDEVLQIVYKWNAWSYMLDVLEPNRPKVIAWHIEN